MTPRDDAPSNSRKHHYPADDAWSYEREEARDAARDVSGEPRWGCLEEMPTRAELGDDA